MRKPLTVGIDARLRSGQPGGVEQFVIGLASGLRQLNEGPERYLFLTLPGESRWLEPYLGGPCMIAPRRRTAAGRLWLTETIPRRALELAPRLRVLRRATRALGLPTASGVPSSSGILEAGGTHLIHFPLQSAFSTDLPSVYQPWDLQHLHLPELFTPDVVAARERRYRAFCASAARIVVATEWAKTDLIDHYELDERKVTVIPVPPPVDVYADASEAEVLAARRRLHLPAQFLFYPAQTWKHKNHIRLLQALAVLKSRHGVKLPLVCSGHRNDHFSAIAREARRLHLEDSTHWVGYVSPQEMKVLYGSARALVFPSLFEGWGLPVVEAFSLGLPVTCSRVTSLPELVGQAALLFDPLDPGDIAEAIWRVWMDGALRDSLVRRGRERVRVLNWLDTARIYRDLYRAIAA